MEKEHFSLKECQREILYVLDCFYHLCLLKIVNIYYNNPCCSKNLRQRPSSQALCPVLVYCLYVKVIIPSLTSNSLSSFLPSLLLLFSIFNRRQLIAVSKPARQGGVNTHWSHKSPHFFRSLSLRWLNVNESQTMIFPHSRRSDGVRDGPRLRLLLIR